MENTVISRSKPTVVAPFSGNELRQWTPDELISFEDDIALEFNSGNIKAPVHLYSGNEKEIIDVFNRVRSDYFWSLHHAEFSGISCIKFGDRYGYIANCCGTGFGNKAWWG